ncbi:MAG: Na(+)/H(+) antiporter subunit B [Planctomycetota bacterium]|nr:Na(+)/H(+) antiporter subunit B [Planctomycetota bacterium]MDP6938763.1 Na(+)/H(+) antiporter subunit B [Planctomycetota bacterium]
MREKVLLRVASKVFIPLILLFGLYVQFHGDFGPGGGFQAGVIFAAGFVLFGLIFGLEALQRVVPWSVVESGVALGLLIFGGVGVICLLRGGQFLDYGVLDHHNSMHGQHLGILIIELGVGLTVAATMMAIFYAMAGRGRT